MLKKSSKLIATSALLLSAGLALAQSPTAPELRNVVQLSASGVVEVQQDLLMLHLATTREGTDAAVVQSELKLALDAALALAKRSAKPGQLDARTGAFGLHPRYSKDGKINGWQGRAELILEGRDFARITSTAAKIESLTIGHVEFGLSREGRAKVEVEAQTAAIEQFKARAAELAKAFGFSNYGLREVTVQSNDMVPSPRMAMLASRAPSMKSADAPVPVEAGTAQVVVNVSGSVQMR